MPVVGKEKFISPNIGEVQLDLLDEVPLPDWPPGPPPWDLPELDTWYKVINPDNPLSPLIIRFCSPTGNQSYGTLIGIILKELQLGICGNPPNNIVCVWFLVDGVSTETIPSEQAVPALSDLKEVAPLPPTPELNPSLQGLKIEQRDTSKPSYFFVENGEKRENVVVYLTAADLPDMASVIVVNEGDEPIEMRVTADIFGLDDVCVYDNEPTIPPGMPGYAEQHLPLSALLEGEHTLNYELFARLPSETEWVSYLKDSVKYTCYAPEPLQKATVLSSAGIFGYVRNKEVIAKKSFGSELDKLSLATLFVNACKAELSIAGEKVGESEAGYNKIATEAIDLGEIATDGKNLEIELKCAHVIGSGLKYAACATIVGLKNE